MDVEPVAEPQLATTSENGGAGRPLAAGVGPFAEGADREQSVVADMISGASKVQRVIEECHSDGLAFDGAVVIDPVADSSPAFGGTGCAARIDHLATVFLAKFVPHSDSEQSLLGVAEGDRLAMSGESDVVGEQAVGEDADPGCLDDNRLVVIPEPVVGDNHHRRIASGSFQGDFSVDDLALFGPELHVIDFVDGDPDPLVMRMVFLVFE